MDILDDMGVSKLSAKVILKVNYSFKLKKSKVCWSKITVEHQRIKLLLLCI